MLKRITAITIAVAVLLAMMPISTAAKSNPFNDVKASDYFAEPVQWAVDEGVTKGTSATTFSPHDTCTRAQIITMIWRSFGCPEPAEKYDIVDIKQSDYYYTAVQWARSIGAFISDKFEPNKGCTRASAVWYIWIANGKTYIPNKAQIRDAGFDDINTSVCRQFNRDDSRYGYAHNYSSGLIIKGVDYNNYYFVMALNWAIAKGVTNGTSATTFSPDNTCTRAQIVALLYRNATSSEKCSNGSHDFSVLSGGKEYVMTAATCSSPNTRYYYSCVNCGLSSKGIKDKNEYDSLSFFNESPKHSYELFLEPTKDRYGLKYCTECGRQQHVAKISNHVHDWESTHAANGAYWAYMYHYGAPSTTLEYVMYVDEGNGSLNYIDYMKSQLPQMDEAGKYYYEKGKRVVLINDNVITSIYMSAYSTSTVYYKCSICGEKQVAATLDELYGPDAIFGTYDTVYGNK